MPHSVLLPSALHYGQYTFTLPYEMSPYFASSILPSSPPRGVQLPGSSGSSHTQDSIHTPQARFVSLSSPPQTHTDLV